MRVISRVLLGLVFAALTIGAGSGTVEDPFLLYGTQTVKLVWDATATDSMVAHAKVEVATDAAFEDIVMAIDHTFEVGGPKNVVPFYHHAINLPDGTYYMRARTLSHSKVSSQWSDPIVVLKDWTPPEKPGGCRIVD